MDFCKRGSVFVIAEIGQNHQGNLNTAKELIKAAKEAGADCVKFQKSCLEEKFTGSVLNRPYDSPNSFGRTYGEHKEYLEFSENEFRELQEYSRSIDILFTASAMDVVSFEFLRSLKVPFIKIGSGDANNPLLLEKAAKSLIPLVVSTGMIDLKAVKRIYHLISKYHKNFALLQCTSAYPVPFEHVNLKVMQQWKLEFPDVILGYSGHEIGFNISIAAVALGAKIIERHFTLDKEQKGSDHRCSLLPAEFRQMINAFKEVKLALGGPIKIVQESEFSCIEKLGKSIVFGKDLLKGHKVSIDDLNIKVSDPKGLDGFDIDLVLSKELKKDVLKDCPVTLDLF